LTEAEERVAEAVLPDAKFRCLICGEVRDNRTYIRYLKPEEKKRTVKEQIEEELKHPAADPRYHERRVEWLELREPVGTFEAKGMRFKVYGEEAEVRATRGGIAVERRGP
jgi:hypothetical protein